MWDAISGPSCPPERAYFPINVFILGQQGLGAASDKVVVADGAQIWFLMTVGPWSRDTDLFVGGNRSRLRSMGEFKVVDIILSWGLG